MDLEIFDDTNSVPTEKIQLVKDILEFSGKYLELPEIGRAHV